MDARTRMHVDPVDDQTVDRDVDEGEHDRLGGEAGSGRLPGGRAAGTPRPDGRSRLKLWWPRMATLICAAAVAALLVAGSDARRDVEAVQRDVREADAAVAVAHDVCAVLLNLQGDGAEAELDALEQVATGDFATQLTTLSSAVGALLQQGEVRSSGSVLSAGVDVIDSTSATVLVAARTVVSNTEIPDGEPRDFRIEVQVIEEDGRWKVSKVEFLS